MSPENLIRRWRRCARSCWRSRTEGGARSDRDAGIDYGAGVVGVGPVAGGVSGVAAGGGAGGVGVAEASTAGDGAVEERCFPCRGREAPPQPKWPKRLRRCDYPLNQPPHACAKSARKTPILMRPRRNDRGCQQRPEACSYDDQQGRYSCILHEFRHRCPSNATGKHGARSERLST